MQLLMWRGTKARGDAWRIIRFCVWGGVRAVHRCEYTRYSIVHTSRHTRWSVKVWVTSPTTTQKPKLFVRSAEEGLGYGL